MYVGKRFNHVWEFIFLILVISMFQPAVAQSFYGSDNYSIDTINTENSGNTYSFFPSELPEFYVPKFWENDDWWSSSSCVKKIPLFSVGSDNDPIFSAIEIDIFDYDCYLSSIPFTSCDGQVSWYYSIEDSPVSLNQIKNLLEDAEEEREYMIYYANTGREQLFSSVDLLTYSFYSDPIYIKFVKHSKNYRNIYNKLISKSSEKVNELYRKVEEEYEKLDHMGVDYPGYSGRAKEVYDHVSDIRDLADTSHPAVSAYFTTKRLSTELKDYYFRDGIKTETVDLFLWFSEDVRSLDVDPSCEYLRALIIGDQSYLTQGIMLYHELKDAEEIMKDEVDELSDTYESLRDERDDLYDEYSWLTQITDIPTEVKLRAHDRLPILNFAAGDVGSFLSSSDEKYSSAETMYQTARSYERDKDEEDYLGHAYEEYLSAIQTMNLSIQQLYQAREAGDVLVETAKEVYNEKHDICQGYVETGDERIRDELRSYLESAESKAKDSDSLGKTYTNYVQAIHILDSCIDLGEGKIGTLSGEDLLSRLEKVLSAAERDGVDVSEEREWLEDHKSENLTPQEYDLLSEAVDRQIESVCSRARHQYSAIFGMRREIRSLLEEMSDYTFSSSSWTSFNRYEVYFTSDTSFRCPEVLGHLHEINNTYSSLLISLERDKDTVLSKVLNSKRNQKVELSYSGIPVVDKPTTLSLHITITNPTSLSTDNPVHVKVPVRYRLLTGDLRDKSDGVDNVVITGSGSVRYVEFDISPVGSHKTYSLNFVWDEVICSVGKRSDTVLSASPEFAEGMREIKITCSSPVESFYDYENITSGIVSVSCDGGDCELMDRSTVRARLGLSERSGEKNLVYNLYYTVASPYNLSKSEVSTETNDQTGETHISYILTLTDVRLPFDSLKIDMYDPIGNSTKVSHFRITTLPSTPSPAYSVRSSVVNGNLYYSFTVKQVDPDHKYEYLVEYDVDNCLQVLSQVYSDIYTRLNGDQSLYDSLSDSDHEDIEYIVSVLGSPNQSSQSLSGGSCSRALARAHKLLNKLEHQQTENTIDRMTYDNIYPEVNSSLGSLSDMCEELSKVNLSDLSQDLSDRLENATRLLNESRQLYEQGQYSEALDLLFQVRNLTDVDLYEELSETRDRLFQDRDELWSRWIALGVDDPQVLDLFDELDDKLSRLRSLSLGEEDLPLLGKTQSLLNQISELIDSRVSYTDTGIVRTLEDIEKRTTQLENKLTNYTNVYSDIKNFKPRHAPKPDLSVKPTDVKRTLSSVKGKIPKLRKRLIDCDESCLREVHLDVQELANKLNDTDLELNRTFSGIEMTTRGLMGKTEKVLPTISGDTTQIRTYIQEAKDALARGDLSAAYISSARGYDLAFELVSGPSPKQNRNNLVILIVVMVLIGLLYLGYQRWSRSSVQSGAGGPEEGGKLNRLRPGRDKKTGKSLKKLKRRELRRYGQNVNRKANTNESE